MVDWYYISSYQVLSEQFIEKYSDKVNWKQGISRYQRLSESFIEKYKDKVDWVYISIYQTLSEQFIERFSDMVDWDNIIYFQKLSYEFLEKNLYKYSLYIDNLCNSTNWYTIKEIQYNHPQKYEIDKITYELNKAYI